MKKGLFLWSTFGAFVMSLSVFAAEPKYVREVARWQAVVVPEETDKAARDAWESAANYSRHEWRVFLQDSRVCAELTNEAARAPKGWPKFNPKAGRFRAASAAKAVDDGWLIAFNQGEFGGALYWFSVDGKRSYKISDHQVVDFYTLSDGIYAIEGLAHMGISEGSLIRIARPQRDKTWTVATVLKLPAAPYAISVDQHGKQFVTLSNSLVSIGASRKIQVLLSDAFWWQLYPNSSALSPDEKKLYIGMRQFVGEFDLQTKKLRLLIPDKVFLHKLPGKVGQ
jgi:hypothetical protein